MMEKKELLQSILNKTVDGKKVFGTAFAIKQEGQTCSAASGNLAPDQAYFIASTTKLFTSAIVLRLQSEARLSIDDKISRYLGPDVLKGLHVLHGHDYSAELSIKHLLAHTSGLPDYFQNKAANGKSLENEIVNGHDQFWTFEQSLERTKAMKPLFVPATRNKAHYSDTNFQLLGKIIEVVSNRSYADACAEFITRPLGLSGTYLYQNPDDNTPKTLYYKSNELHIPKAMTSFGPDGGLVSNAPDMLRFIEAFFNGILFPAEYIPALQEWNKIFFPMQAGVGIHLFKLPWYLNPTGAVPSFIGHSGLSGALAYYCPAEKLYVAGTVNQVAYPDLSFRTMIKLARLLKKK